MTDLQCPRCGKAMPGARVGSPPSFPFCSRRCKLIDLGEWLDEAHRISTPLPQEGPEDDDPGAPPDLPEE